MSSVGTSLAEGFVLFGGEPLAAAKNSWSESAERLLQSRVETSV